jgi:hypothetical protein
MVSEHFMCTRRLIDTSRVKVDDKMVVAGEKKELAKQVNQPESRMDTLTASHVTFIYHLIYLLDRSAGFIGHFRAGMRL